MIRDGDVAADDGGGSAGLWEDRKCWGRHVGACACEEDWVAVQLQTYSACCECGRGYVVQCKCGDACSAREVFEPLRGHGMKLSCSKRCNGKGSCLMPWHSWGVLGCCAHAGAVEVGREICRACRWNMPLSQQFSTTGVWWIYLEGLVFWRRHMH
jgi:hypothetical protein